jgi:hypothetical protein
MTSEIVQKYARIALYYIAGALTTHGIITAGASWVEPVIGVLLTLINFAWTLYGGRLNGLLAQVQGKDGVLSTNIVVDQSVIDPLSVTASTPPGVTAK